MLITMSEEIRTSEDKNDSEMSHVRQSDEAEKIIKELNDMRGLAKDKVEQLIKQLRQDKLKDHEIKKVLFARVDFVSRPTLYRALPQEFKRDYTKPLPKTINISSEHKVIDVEPEPIEIKGHEPHWDTTSTIKQDMTMGAEEDPKEIENQFLKEKVTELEDALRKTEQFKPASALEQLPEVIEAADKEDKRVHSWLKNSADGIGSFYYDTYGIDLFKNRELTQLKNSRRESIQEVVFRSMTDWVYNLAIGMVFGFIGGSAFALITWLIERNKK